MSKPRLTLDEYRARKAERRARQRLANVGRALKMHVARVAYENEQTLVPQVADSACPAPSIPNVNIGCSGWFYWHWRDRFYPPGMATKNWVEHYASHFDTVELNAPFYSWPTEATVRSWARQVAGRRFWYTVKACELITHVKQFSRTAELVDDYYLIDRLLQPHLGCFLFQLPPSFHYSAARLKRILDQLDPSKRNVVEFRHRSWWNKQTIAAFRKTNTIFCSCSAPRLPDELVQTGDDIYIRFHGISRWYRHDYTADELSAWAAKIRSHKGSRIWAYFNNDFGGYAIDNARQLRCQLTDSDEQGSGLCQ